jgi:hypothetical protein
MANTLQTRISLKYDSYAKWNKWFLASAPETELTEAPNFRADGFNFDDYANKGANLKLNKGEVALCEIPRSNAEATTAPTVLFKVGDGTRRFCELTWASALAADVYGWAKASDVRLSDDGKAIKFVGAKNADGTDKTIPLNFLSSDDAAELAGRVTTIETLLGVKNVDGKDVAVRIDTIESSIETLNGDADTKGSVAKAIADSEATTKAAYEAYADQAEADALQAAKDYVDGDDGVKQGLAAHIADKNNPHGVTAETLGLDKVENKSVAEIKTDLGKEGAIEDGKTGFVTGGAVYTAVKAAEQKVTDLANDQVATNTQNIADLQEAVGEAAEGQTDKSLYQLIAEEASTRGIEDGKLDTRLKKVETFFEGAYAEDGKSLNEALDTLVEIQDYLDGDGTAAGDLVSKIASLENEFGKTGRVTEAEGDIDELEQNMAAAQADLNDLKSIAKSYLAKTGEGENAAVTEDAIRIAIDAAKKAGDDAQDGVDAINEVLEDTKDSEGKVTSAGLVTTVGNIATTIGDANNGLVADNEANKQNIADLLAAIGDENGGLVKDVAALQGTIGNADSGLVKDVAALQAIVSAEGGNSNEQLRADIGELQTKVNDASTGLAKTYEIATDAKDIADQNAEDIAEIQENNVSSDGTNLLYKGDIIIFDCGGSGV